MRVANCTAGTSSCIFLRVTSSLPAPIEVDELCVTYAPFKPFAVHEVAQQQSTSPQGSNRGAENASVANPSPFKTEALSLKQGRDWHPRSINTNTTKMTDDGFPPSSSMGLGVGRFLCRPLEGHYHPSTEDTSVNKVLLQPGEQMLVLHFAPTSCGEFAPCAVKIRVGNVEFLTTIVSDLNKLHPFFNKHSVVNVTVPKEVLDLRAFAPTFSPRGHQDLGGLSIKPQPHDKLLSLFVYIHAAPVTEKSLLPQHSDSLEKETPELGSSNSSSLNAKAEVGRDCAAMGLVTQTASEFTSSANSNRTHKTSVEVESPKNWTFQCLLEGECVTNHSIVSIQNGGLLMEDLPESSLVHLKVPYKSSALIDTKSTDIDHFALSFCAEGTLIRNHCTIDFEMQVEKRLYVGQPLVITQHTTELFGNQYYSQCLLQNICPLPISVYPHIPPKFNIRMPPLPSAGEDSSQTQVVTYEVMRDKSNSYSNASDSDSDKDCDKDCDKDRDRDSYKAKAWADADAVVLLQPGEVYHVGIGLVQAQTQTSAPIPTDRGAGTTSSIGNGNTTFPTILFPLQRCYHLDEVADINTNINKNKNTNTNTGADTHATATRTAPLSISDSSHFQYQTLSLFNSAKFYHRLVIDPPCVLPLVYSMDYIVTARIPTTCAAATTTATTNGATNANVVATSTKADQNQNIYKLGKPLECVYTLKVVYPSNSDSNGGSGSNNDSGCMEEKEEATSRLFTICYPPTEAWAVLGKTKRVVQMTAKVE